uniref:Uncharacterized protein n=1 Tax=Caenorhabditis japonica TaxID=281687 RepID=K7IJY7_CAEJA
MSRSKWVKTENPSTNNTIHHPPRHRRPANTREIPKCRRHEFACRMEFEVNTFPGSSLLRSNSTRPHPPLLSTITHDTTPPSNSAVTFSQDGFQPPPTIMPFTALLLLR